MHLALASLLFVNELRNLLGTFIMSLKMEPCIVHVALLFCSVPFVFIITISMIFNRIMTLNMVLVSHPNFLFLKMYLNCHFHLLNLHHSANHDITKKRTHHYIICFLYQNIETSSVYHVTLILESCWSLHELFPSSFFLYTFFSTINR